METQEIPPPSVVNAQKDPLHKPHLTQSECRNNQPIIRVGQTVPATVDPALPAHVDIVGVSSTYDPITTLFTVVLTLRDLPPQFSFNRFAPEPGFVIYEYHWEISIDVDDRRDTGFRETGVDYYLSVEHITSEGDQPFTGPLMGNVEAGLWQWKAEVYEGQEGAERIDNELNLIVDVGQNTLTLQTNEYEPIVGLNSASRIFVDATDYANGEFIGDSVGCIPDPIPTTPTPTSPPATPTPTSPPVTPTPSATPTPIQVNTQINGGSGGEIIIPRDRRITVLLFVPPAALPNELFTVRYTGLPLLDLVLPNQQTMTGRFQTEAIGATSGTVLRTDRLLTMIVDLAPRLPQLAQTTPLSPVIYARQGDAWVPAETRCIGMGCQQQVSGTRVTLLLDYVGEFAVGITPQRIYLPLIVRGQ